MDKLLQSKITWSCRRGMKELDLLLMPFAENCFLQLTKEQQFHFEQLLMLDDLTLFDCFFKHKKLTNINLNRCIMLIQQFQQCGKLS